MSKRPTTLPLPAAIDAAYLLLIAQLCLTLSKLAFGVLFVAEENVSINTDVKSLIIWALSILIVSMLFINIISCWKSTRSTFDELGYYPNSLLTSDVFILICFFFLNSTAAAPVNFMKKLTLEQTDINNYLNSIASLWEPMLPLLFFTSALLVLSYRSWNKSYIKEITESESSESAISKRLSQFEVFNSLYVSFAIVFAISGIVQILFDEFIMTIILLAIWIFFWCYINFNWFIKPPTS